MALVFLALVAGVAAGAAIGTPAGIALSLVGASMIASLTMALVAAVGLRRMFGRQERGWADLRRFVREDGRRSRQVVRMVARRQRERSVGERRRSTSEIKTELESQLQRHDEHLKGLGAEIEHLGDELVATLDSSLTTAMAGLRANLEEVGARAAQDSGTLAKRFRKFEAGIATQRARIAADQVRQVQALVNLFTLVELERPAPMLGGWAVSPELMLWLADELLTTRHELVVECGSGASTVWMSLVARQFDLPARFVAIEHDEGFGKQTREELNRHGLSDRAEVRIAPLAAPRLPRHETPWYFEGALEDLHDIDLLFVDGPPGDIGPMSRFPAIPLLHTRLASSCTVVLDDAARPDERSMSEEWQLLLPDFSRQELDVQKGAVIFRRGESAGE